MTPILKMTLLSVTAGLFLGSAAQARDKQEPKLFGGWELTKFVITGDQGQAVPFCEGAHGKLIYEKSGSVSVAINCGDAPTKGTPAEEFGGMLFYSGSFSIQGDVVLHRIENSNVLELIGKEVPRTVESLTESALVLTGKLGVRPLRIEWRRIETAPELDPREELALLTYLKLKPGTEDAFMQEFGKIIKPSLAEPGNIAWFVQRSEEDPTSVVFYTRWLNEAALQAHLKSPPLADYIARTAGFLEPGYPKLVKYHPLDLQE